MLFGALHAQHLPAKNSTVVLPKFFPKLITLSLESNRCLMDFAELGFVSNDTIEPWDPMRRLPERDVLARNTGSPLPIGLCLSGRL